MSALGQGVCLVRWADPGDRPLADAAHDLARAMLGDVLRVDPAAVSWIYRCSTCGGPHGKPYVDGVHFSLSHTQGLVAVAVAADPVGIDVEVVTPRFDAAELAGVALTGTERARFDTLPAEVKVAAMLRTWTRKEALLKADGRGLSVSPDRVGVAAAEEPPALVEWTETDRPAGAQLFDLALGPRRFGAVAVLSGTPYRIEAQDPAGSARG